MGYGFLLTSVFEELGIPLQKRVGFQVSDEIESSTLIGCGFKVIKGQSQFISRHEESRRVYSTPKSSK